MRKTHVAATKDIYVSCEPLPHASSHSKDLMQEMAGVSLANMVKRPRLVACSSTSQGNREHPLDVVNEKLNLYHGYQISSTLSPGIPFKAVKSDLIPADSQRVLAIGDVCAEFTEIQSDHEVFTRIIAAYNNYVVKGASAASLKVVSGFTGTRDIIKAAITMEDLTKEWNGSIERYHSLVEAELTRDNGTNRPDGEQFRSNLYSTILQRLTKHVPARPEDVWNVVHALINSPKLVKNFVHIIGPLAWVCNQDKCFTGKVSNPRLPNKPSINRFQIYLVAGPWETSGVVKAALGKSSGVKLSLMYAATRLELLEQINVYKSEVHFLHVGTETSGQFEISTSTYWQVHRPTIHDILADDLSSWTANKEPSFLAGDTTDSARELFSRN